MKVPTIPRRQWQRPSRRRVVALRDRLRSVYAIPVAPPHEAPVDELILTILSQSTSDRNRDVAFLRLREHFPGVPEAARGTGSSSDQPCPAKAGPQANWAAVRDAPREDVEAAIAPGGLQRQKSARIQAVLCALGDPIDLGALRDMSVPEARVVLTALPGVGRKTTACVLLFAFGMDDVPVDTHVSRVGTRLGLLRPGAGFEELHDDLLAMLRPGEALEVHVNLLRHGRRTCHAQRPRCEACVLNRSCPKVGVPVR